MSDEKINFYAESHSILFNVLDLTVGQEKELREKFIDWGRSIAARVEEETIKRCEVEIGYGKIPRLYAEKGKP